MLTLALVTTHFLSSFWVMMCNTPRTEQHALQPQTSDFSDSENPRLESSDYQSKPELSSDETHTSSDFLQLNELRAIYAELVMVETKCIDIDKQQSENPEKLTDAEWQALIALHRTLLFKHYEFFLALNHPSASDLLHSLPDKYSMPSRLWRYGIYSFLELLRKRLPDSLEHIVAFIYLAYSIMTLHLENVPGFDATWIEFLGDLARYRMAIEKVDMHDRETWNAVSKRWHSKAADIIPNVGRLQHHMAVLARPDLLQQLFYYSKALTSTEPFTNARNSINLVFRPLLDSSEPVNPINQPTLVTFVKAHALLFNRGEIPHTSLLIQEFLGQLNAHIDAAGVVFREQAVYMMSANFAAVLDFGSADSRLFPMFDSGNFQKPKREIILEAYQYWSTQALAEKKAARRQKPVDHPAGVKFETSDQAVFFATNLAFNTLGAILLRPSQPVLPCVHLSLAFLWCTALVPKSMEAIQEAVPWTHIVGFLNALIKQEMDMSGIANMEFPWPEPGSAKQLPEDYYIRGLAWSQPYYPVDFFAEKANYEERSIEFPSATVTRTRRCLWLGFQISKMNCWIQYNEQERCFCVTQHVEKREAFQ